MSCELGLCPVKFLLRSVVGRSNIILIHKHKVALITDTRRTSSPGGWPQQVPKREIDTGQPVRARATHHRDHASDPSSEIGDPLSACLCICKDVQNIGTVSEEQQGWPEGSRHTGDSS